jgi:nucleotide-binding universal stress UspA family protein
MMKILCATDLLPKTESAMDRAGMLAEHLDAELSFLHVVPLTESDQLLAEDLRRASGKLELRVRPPLRRYGAHPNVYVRAGSPARVLIKTMKAGAGLIVLGRHLSADTGLSGGTLPPGAQ